MTAFRYLSTEELQEILHIQLEMIPFVLKQLYDLGITPQDQLAVEYFFYTDTEQKAKAFCSALRTQYKEVDIVTAPGDSKGESLRYCISGWTGKMQMDQQTVAIWMKEIIALGAQYDAAFDGWGTIPDLE